MANRTLRNFKGTIWNIDQNNKDIYINGKKIIIGGHVVVKVENEVNVEIPDDSNIVLFPNIFLSTSEYLERFYLDPIRSMIMVIKNTLNDVLGVLEEIRDCECQTGA